MLENFILHLTHQNRDEADDEIFSITSNQLYAMVDTYIEEDWVDGEQNPSDSEKARKMDLFELENFMVTIYEGGSNYWFNVHPRDRKEIRAYFADHVGTEGASFAEKMAKYLWDGRKIEVIDAEDPEETLGELTLEKINKVMNDPKLAEEAYEFWNETYDVETTDVLLQHALFGEVVYG